MPDKTYTRRAAIWSAVWDLMAKGYRIDRCCGKDRTFDLIAWNKKTTLCLLIRTARTAHVRSYRDDVVRIGALVRESMIPGPFELWCIIRRDGPGMPILSGGALVIGEESA
jgi:hypothetical protein